MKYSLFALLFALSILFSNTATLLPPEEISSPSSSQEEVVSSPSDSQEASLPQEPSSSLSSSSSVPPISESSSSASPSPVPSYSPEPSPVSSEPEKSASSSSQLETSSRQAFSTYADSENFLSKVEQKVVELTNDEREANGLSRLPSDSTLQQAARIRSRELYENNHFDHTRPNGDSWATVLTDDLGYEFHHAGENLASVEYNDPNGTYAYDAAYWVDGWINSPPHHENMLRDTYTKMGVGIYLAQEGDMTIAYATTIFSD